jgi:hypothetical protein
MDHGNKNDNYDDDDDNDDNNNNNNNDVVQVNRHNTPIHNILSTAPQLSITQKALGTLPDDGNVMPKHVGATTHN